MAQSALKTVEGHKAVIVQDGKIPDVADNYILVETRAVAINPTDWKHMKSLTGPGVTLGCDWSGVVVKVGKDVTRFKPGQEVFGVVHGGNDDKPDGGAFARFVACYEGATFHRPQNMSFEEAASMGVGLYTVGQDMYYLEGLPLPAAENLKQEPTRDIVVYGGSSATGTLAIQFGRLSGCRVISTSSPSNFGLLEDRGANHVFSSYDAKTTVPAIQSLTSNKLDYILDCIGNEKTAEFCSPLLSTTTGGTYHSVQWPVSPKFKELRPEENVQAKSALAYDLLGEPYAFRTVNRHFDGDEVSQAWVRDVWQPTVDGLLKQELLKSHPVHVTKGDLAAVLKGMEDVETGKAPSGKKLVVSLEW